MRHIKITALRTSLLCVSGLGLFAANAPAYAGGCGLGVNPALCQTGVNVNAGTGPVFGNPTVNINQPFGHLRGINYQRAPNTSITRLHGLQGQPELSDFPSSFTNGCHPSSTTYCRQDAGTPVNIEFAAPQVQAPTFAPAPSAFRTVAVGGGYDPSKFIPRQYGEFSFTPGIAYVPTSYVNRNPADAARVLAENGYSTTGSYQSGSINLSAPTVSSSFNTVSAAPSFAAPSFAPVGGPNLLAGGPIGQAPRGAQYLGSVVTGTTTTGSSAPSGNVLGGVDGSGGYWEQVSGLTMFGDTVATSVVCRRQAPQTTAQVVSPVYGVPQPVPTPVPYFVDVPYKVKGKAIPKGCRPAGAPFVGQPQRPRFQQPQFAGPRPVTYGQAGGFQAAVPSSFGPQFGRVSGVAPTVGQFGGHSGQVPHAGWTY